MKNIKSFIVGFITCAVLFSTAAIASNTITPIYDNIRIIVNGVDKTPTEADLKPYIAKEYGRTMVSVRAIAELLDKQVDWDGASKSVLINDKVEKVSEVVEDKKEGKEGDEVKQEIPIQNTKQFEKTSYDGMLAYQKGSDIYVHGVDLRTKLGEKNIHLTWSPVEQKLFIIDWETKENLEELSPQNPKEVVIINGRTYIHLDIVKKYL